MPSPQDRRIQLILSPTATSNTMSIFQSDHKEEILLKYKHVSVVLPFKGTSCFWSQKGSVAPLILLRAKCGFLNPGSLIPLGPYSEAMGKKSLSPHLQRIRCAPSAELSGWDHRLVGWVLSSQSFPRCRWVHQHSIFCSLCLPRWGYQEPPPLPKHTSRYHVRYADHSD